MFPIPINHTDWNEIIGTRPSHLSVTPTDPTNTDQSTADTIKLMQQYAIADAQSEQVIEAANEIRDKAIDSNDPNSLIDTTFEWVKDHVQFTEDENVLRRLFNIESGTELLIKPSRLLSMQNPMGDCDDFSMLTQSILTNLGIESSFVTVAANKQQPDKWSHVYNQATLDSNKVIPIDTSHGKHVGWEAPGISRKGIWKENNNSMDLGRIINLSGIGDTAGDYADVIASGAEGGWDSGSPVSIFSSGSGFDWGSIFKPLSNAGAQILTAQYGQPQLAPGTYIRRADGSILTNQPVTGGMFPSSSVGMSGMLPILLVGGLILAFAASRH